MIFFLSIFLFFCFFMNNRPISSPEQSFVDTILDTPDMINEIATYIYDGIDSADVETIEKRSQEVMSRHKLSRADLTDILDAVDSTLLARLFRLTQTRVGVILQKKNTSGADQKKLVRRVKSIPEFRVRADEVINKLNEYKESLRKTDHNLEKQQQIHAKMVEFLMSNGARTTFDDWWVVYERMPHPWPEKFHETYFFLRKKVISHLLRQSRTISDCEALLSIQKILPENEVKQIIEMR